MTEGLNPIYRDRKWDVLHAYLDAVACIEGVNQRPRSRADCVFCYKYRKYGINGAGEDNVTAVIDTEELSNNIYIADQEKATVVAQYLNKSGSTVIPSFNVGNPPSDIQDLMSKDSFRAYVNSRRYWKSCQTYSCNASIDGIHEVLVESLIPEEAIVTFYTPDA